MEEENGEPARIIRNTRKRKPSETPPEHSDFFFNIQRRESGRAERFPHDNENTYIMTHKYPNDKQIIITIICAKPFLTRGNSIMSSLFWLDKAIRSHLLPSTILQRQPNPDHHTVYPYRGTLPGDSIVARTSGALQLHVRRARRAITSIQRVYSFRELQIH
jgi:hypothetical protein